MVGIYKITNKVNGKFYVGQSIDIERRFRNHKRKAPVRMREDVELFGWENFAFEVIEECDANELDEKETYYIVLLNPEYNTLIEGCGVPLEVRQKISRANLGRVIPNEVREKISRAHKGKIVSEETRKKLSNIMKEKALADRAVICLETNEHFRSIVEASVTLGIAPQNISAALHGRQATAGGYTWKFADEKFQATAKTVSQNHKLILCIETGEVFKNIVEAEKKLQTPTGGISNVLHGRAMTAGGFHFKYANGDNSKIRGEESRKPLEKTVFCVETGEVFESSVAVAKKFGVHPQSIRGAIRNNTKVKGLHWNFFDENDRIIHKTKIRKTTAKPVVCVETGEIFESVKQAAEKVGVNHSAISMVLSGRRNFAGGFHWKYYERNS